MVVVAVAAGYGCAVVLAADVHVDEADETEPAVG